jgi:hypothetical protein
MEAERFLFNDLIGKFNESTAMPRGVLYVPVSLPAVNDKRPLQFTVDQNIRQCRHYILLLAEDWGPVERRFHHDYQLALECLADSAMPMQDVAVLLKKPLSGSPLPSPLPEDFPAPRGVFSTPAEFSAHVNDLLSAWLES